jgi:hypothetical protein
MDVNDAPQAIMRRRAQTQRRKSGLRLSDREAQA